MTTPRKKARELFPREGGSPAASPKKSRAKQPATPKSASKRGGPGSRGPRTPKSASKRAKGSPRNSSKNAGRHTVAEQAMTMRMFEVAQEMRHFCKNQQALKWCIYEFFYSSLDQCLLRDSNTFKQCLRETFPKIAEMEDLKQFEWFYMRKALGRPRRFSQAFIRSEVEVLNLQRTFIRQLQQGSQPEQGKLPLPRNIPLPLCVGKRVLARPNVQAGRPGGQLLPGYLLAIMSSQNSYRVQFDAASEKVQTVEDTQLATTQKPETIAVSVLMKERVYVPSAGIAERPRLHRRATSIQSLEQKRSDFSGGQNVMSSQLMDKESERLADGYRLRIDTLCGQGQKLAGASAAEPQDPAAAKGTLVQLVSVFEQLLQVKQALLQDQEELNATARRLLAEESPPSPELLQHYKFVRHYIQAINESLQSCSVAIRSRKGSNKVQQARSAQVASPGTASAKFQQQAGQIASAALTSAGKAAGMDSRALALIKHYVSQLLAVGSCAQRQLSPEDTALVTRELAKAHSPVDPANHKYVCIIWFGALPPWPFSNVQHRAGHGLDITAAAMYSCCCA